MAALLCAASAADAETVGVEIYRLDDTFITSMHEAMEDAAAGQVELKVSDGQNDQSVQNEQICSHVADGVDVLAVNPVDPAASSIILEKAQTAGIPVVFFNCEPDAAEMPDDGWYYVGAPAQQSGAIEGEMMAEYFEAHPEADRNGDGVIQYVLLEGQAGHQDAAIRSEYSVKTFKAAGFQVSMVASERANWQRSEARDIMTEWLAAYDNIEAVFANDDDMALGAIDALKTAGYFSGGRFMPVVGVDASTQALEAMQQGTLLGTVFNDAINQGRAVVRLAQVLARGETPTSQNVGYPISNGRYIWIPYRKVTADTRVAG
jgi:methyl-galactoside transport system substrate-binding protein